ncbi:hypothetical protein [Pedococcus sp. 2YAF34]|uniref:hypothetical protein n=1 Tax=Pedococcus sp. 2YAF34 TaxID=3233032 RepID=UPI003F9CCA89
MSDRRKARGATPVRAGSGVPSELMDVSHPVWHDEAALAERFPDLVDGQIISRLRMGGRVYQQVVSRWCLANGYESQTYAGRPDWRRFRAACAGQDAHT